jgi:hypothetical protein
MVDIEPRRSRHLSTWRQSRRWQTGVIAALALLGLTSLTTACAQDHPAATSIAEPVAPTASTTLPAPESQQFCATTKSSPADGHEYLESGVKENLLVTIGKIIKPELLRGAHCIEAAFTTPPNAGIIYIDFNGTRQTVIGRIHHDKIDLTNREDEGFEIERISANGKEVTTTTTIYGRPAIKQTKPLKSFQDKVGYATQYLADEIQEAMQWAEIPENDNEDSRLIMEGTSRKNYCRVEFREPERPISVYCPQI